MKIAIIVQRFGKDILGGAESHARQIGYHLANDLKINVDILTTTANCYDTWKNHYKEGIEKDGPLVVRRFHSTFGRFIFFSLLDKFLRKSISYLNTKKNTDKIINFLEQLWFFAQGPVNYRLLKYIEKNKDFYDYFIFFTYLYHPTVCGLNLVKDKAILIPTAHDEPAFHFRKIKNILQECKTILVNSKPEEALVASKISNSKNKIQIVGLGFDSLANEDKSKTPSKDNYILYLGRISKGKGVDKLIEYFTKAIYDKKIPSDLKLYLAGKIEDSISNKVNSSIVFLDFVTDDKKLSLIKHSKALVNSSAFESLSMMAIEGMAFQIPLIANGDCDVFRFYEKQTKTVFCYKDYTTFVKLINFVLENKITKKDLQESKKWAFETYSWEAVMNKYKDNLILQEKTNSQSN